MGLFDRIVPDLAARFQIPHAAAQAAIATVVKAHQGDAAATASIVKAASGSSERVRSVLGAAYAALKADPAFWTAHYATKARTQPLHPSHPYAAHINAALQRIGAPALPMLTSGHGHGGGHGGGHHGGGHHGHGGRARGGRGGVVWGGGWDGPWYDESPEYILVDKDRLDAELAPATYGGASAWNKGGQ